MDQIDRVVVGKEIVSHLLANNMNRIITSEEFVKLACLITEVFKNEAKGTYYTPSCHGHSPKGKLYSAYTNYRTQLREAQLVQKKKQGRPRKKTNRAGSETEEITDEEGDSNSFDLADDNFEAIIEFWKTTYADRRKQILNNLSLTKYLAKYPMLKLATGYKLFELDAIEIHGDFVSDLPSVSEKIFIYAKRIKSPSLPIKSLLAEFERTLDLLDEHSVSVFNQLTALKLLPHVMPNPHKNKSKSEVAKQFIPTAIEEENLNKEEVTPKEPTTLSIIGDLVHPHAYITIADQVYMIENPIYAFEVLFKTYLSFDQKFPVLSSHVWTFITQSVFNIRPKARPTSRLLHSLMTLKK